MCDLDTRKRALDFVKMSGGPVHLVLMPAVKASKNEPPFYPNRHV